MEKLNPKPIPSWSFDVDNVERWAYIPEAFTSQECDEIIRICNQYKMRMATVQGRADGGTVRESNVVFLGPEQELQWVYRRLTDHITQVNQKFFGFDLFGFTEALQFTEYIAPTGRYDFHVDKAMNSVVRKLSIVVQLTDDRLYQGGDFELYDSSTPEKLPRQKGTMLLFPSYSLHRVSPVTAGVRHSLVGWISGKPFK